MKNAFLLTLLLLCSFQSIFAQDAPIEIFKVVEQMPRFPGCEDIENESERKSCAQKELLRYIYANLSYPQKAREQGIEGTVVVTFVVQKDGILADPRIVRSVGGGCDEEALRIIDKMIFEDLRWIPGAQRGTPLHVQYNLPIKFKLDSRPSRRSRRLKNGR